MRTQRLKEVSQFSQGLSALSDWLKIGDKQSSLPPGQGKITEQTGFHTVGCKQFMGHEEYSEVKDSIKK